MGLFLLTCYVCDKKQLGSRLLFTGTVLTVARVQPKSAGTPGSFIQPSSRAPWAIGNKDSGFCKASIYHSSPYFQGPRHPPVSTSRSIFLQIKTIWDASGRGAKYRGQSPKSKIKIQTQYLLEHTDLSEVTLKGKIEQIAQTRNERKEVPGGVVQERSSHRTESVCWINPAWKERGKSN